MTGLSFIEPDGAAAWSPFLGATPLAQLRAGVWTIAERWDSALGTDGRGDGLAEGDREVPVVARSDFAPGGDRVPLDGGTQRLVHQGETVAWIGSAGRKRTDEGPSQEIDGLLLRGAFDLVTALEVFLGPDCDDFLARPAGPVPAQSIVLGDPARVRITHAEVEPGVVFDVRHGTIVIEQGAEVRNGTRIEGPCYVGPGTRVLGGFIRASSLGPKCVVRGEVSATVFNGFANKAHDGFVGHSVVGHWVNLGAGTTTSNLKNTYGNVRLSVGPASIETGRQFLGTLFGDHAKAAIGTMFSTGTVVGTGANVFGPGLGKYVPPFAWGANGKERMNEAGFLQVAERVMPRRGMTADTAALRRIYRALSPDA